MKSSGGIIELRPYQIEASGRLADALQSHGVAVDLSDTGLGKTFHALAAVKSFDAPFAVICRASSRHKWEKAVSDFGLAGNCLAVDSWQRFTNGRNHRELVTRQNSGRSASYSWNPEKPTVVIFDEVQDAGGQTSLNSQLLIGIGRSNKTYAICLSATVADSPLKLKALGFLCGLHNLQNFYGWAMDHGCGKSPFGYNQLYFKPRESRWVIPKLRDALAPFGVRVCRDTVSEYLPQETVETELWDVGNRPNSGPVSNALEQLEDTRDEDLARHEDGTPGAVEQMRDRQEAELRRLIPLVAEIKAAVESGMFCPVFLNFTASVDTLSTMLKSEKIDVGIFDGRNHKQREIDRDLFMEGKVPVLILQSAAGSASIDLHDTAGGRPRMTFISPTYHAETMIQMLGRAVRFGAKSPVIQRIIFAEGTIEQKVYKVVEGKAKNIRALNDGEWVAAFGGA
jgi:superfamily II DNA or RNA helicase